MSAGRFASLTPNLLVRKGEAAPSFIAPGVPRPFGRPLERAEARAAPPPLEPGHVYHPSVSASRAETYAGQAPHELTRSASSDKPRRMMVTLTPVEYETLGLIAVKRCTTRHQLLRSALDEYLEAVVEECGGACHCIGSGWSCGTSL